MGCSRSVLTDTIVSKNMITPEFTSSVEIIENENFQKIRTIGKGNYGEIFLIRSKKTGREYALKAIIINNMTKKKVPNLMREVDNLKKLNHPNIISFKCAFTSNIKAELLNIMTEYADNGDLNRKLEENRKEKKYFKENQLLDWLIQISLALKYIHKQNIIHRDIKPSNIFLMKNNTVKLGDFGISKNIEIFHKTNTFIGTPAYLAPEIILNKGYSLEADIFSLGTTFCHLMALELPFEGGNIDDIYKNILERKKNKKILNKEKNNYIQNILDNYSKEFLDLIDELMSQNPKNRPTAEQILEKDIIKKRMNLYLKENNFNSKDVENFIQNYEQNEIKEDFEEEKNKTNLQIIITENDNNNEDLNKTQDVTPLKNNKVKYDFQRQMSLIHNNLLKKKTFM